MTRNINKEEYRAYVDCGQNTQISGYSLAALAGCLLLCAGIILYAFLAA